MTPWVLRIIIANVFVYVLTVLRPPFMEFLSFVPALALLKPWSIVTYMFAHDLSGISHILFNMLSLFFFGPKLEDYLGGKHFLGLYFLSGVMGAVLSVVFSPNSSIIGASGAVYGVMLAYAMLWPRDNVYVWGVMPVQVRMMVIFMTVMSLWGGFSPTSDGIAHFAHLGGFVGGFAYMKLIRQQSRIVQMQRRIVEPIALSGDIQRWKLIRREALHEVNRDEYDRIMTKLDANGVASLSETEKAFLNRFSAN